MKACGQEWSIDHLHGGVIDKCRDPVWYDGGVLSPTITRFLKYSSIGVSTFLFDLLLLWLLIEYAGANYLIAAAVAFVIAVSVNYIASRRYVFRGSLRQVGVGYVQFLLIAGAGLCFVVGAMYVLVEHLAVSYVVARIMVAVVTGFWNYLMNLYVNFQVAGRHHQ